MDPGSSSSTSVPPESKFPLIRHIHSSRQLSFCSSFSSSAPSAEPIIPHKDEQNQTQVKTSRLESLSSIIIANNEDLLTQIFLLLPPKCLIRFKSVSKKWLSVISSPAFCRLHSRFYPTIISTPSSSVVPAALFLFRKVDIMRELNFISFHQDYTNSMCNIISRLSNFLDGEILQLHSCNGILCIEFSFDQDRREFVVYNPTTNQHRLIPRCKLGNEQYKFLTVNIAFDIVKSDHYKLVSVWATHVEDEFRFMVYSSETGVWRETTETFQMFGEPYYFERGVLWNGGLHWAREWSGILCFDLDNQCLRPVIPNPPTPYFFWWDILYFGESGEQLYFIGLNKPHTTEIQAFSLKRDYSEWVVNYVIDVAPLITLYPSMAVAEYEYDKLFDFNMPCFLVDKKEKKVQLVISLDGKVISYDINDVTVKELAEVDIAQLSFSFRDASKYNWREAHQHIETLAYI